MAVKNISIEVPGLSKKDAVTVASWFVAIDLMESMQEYLDSKVSSIAEDIADSAEDIEVGLIESAIRQAIELMMDTAVSVGKQEAYDAFHDSMKGRTTDLKS